jgi:hypothetical protein
MNSDKNSTQECIELVRFLKKMPGFTLVDFSEAPHCGAIYVGFEADESTLIEILTRNLYSYSHAYIGVCLHNGKIMYYINFGIGCAGRFVRGKVEE